MTASPTPQPTFELLPSRGFEGWLAEHKASLAFSTYQAGKVFLLGTKPDGKLAIFNRTLERSMGMAVTDNALYVSTISAIIKFENALRSSEVTSEGYDRVYVPQMAWYTADLDIHDLAEDRHGLIFVNTLFGCLARPSQTHSFEPVWKPPFLSRLAAEDRCHLNGLAIKDKRAAYVTAVSTSDINDGWREHRHNGGVVVDVQSNEIVASGLSMPHSPRWHQDRLWLHNSGTGEFGTLDLDTGRFTPVAFCPGYLRGMAMMGDYAIVGLSEPRDNKTFSGLVLQDRLDAEQISARCGLQVIDLRTGDTVHWVRISGVVSELYDVMVLPGTTNPCLIGFQSDEIRRMISLAPWPDEPKL